MMKKDLVTRLARIEGQVAALKHSLEQDTAIDCTATLIQVKAATNGLKRFAEVFSRTYAKQCVVSKMSRERLDHELGAIISSAFTLS